MFTEEKPSDVVRMEPVETVKLMWELVEKLRGQPNMVVACGLRSVTNYMGWHTQHISDTEQMVMAAATRASSGVPSKGV